MKTTIIFFLALILLAQVHVILFRLPHREVITQHENLNRAIVSFGKMDALMTPELHKRNMSQLTLFRIHTRDNRDLNMLPSFHVSVATIVTRPDVHARVEQITNNPAAMYATVLPDLLNGLPVFSIVRDMPESALKELLQERGAKATLFIDVKDSRRQISGFIVASWDDEASIPQGLELKDTLAEMRELAIKLGAFFGLPPVSHE